MMLDVLIVALIASTDALHLKLKCMFEEAHNFDYIMNQQVYVAM